MTKVIVYLVIYNIILSKKTKKINKNQQKQNIQTLKTYKKLLIIK